MNKTYRASRSSPATLTSPDKLSLVVTLDDTCVNYTRGIITKRSEMIPYDKINSVNVQQGPLEATMNYGTVLIATGNDVEPITLDDIEDPAGLRDDITSMMAQVRTPAAASPAAAAPMSAEDEIEKLGNLLQQGMITQDEFDAKKRQLLGL